MRCARVGLDQFSFTGALAATANLAMLAEGQQLHNLFIKLGFDPNIYVINAAMDMHGYFQKARATFHEMLELGSKPNRVTFVSLVSACNHGGLVDEGLSYFASMTKNLESQQQLSIVYA
ncbi:Pentatricopeptide repeat [Dillenia turbinata]|uniref:Pentatricopeptide repeat n=1 Tax=Dillenia turbinata TaxID=194707 RepID=A0AAN8VH37_9MAGN